MKPREYVDREKKKLARMTWKQRAEYIAEYYWLPILLVIAAVCFSVSYIHAQLTRKDILLYATMVNVTLNDSLTGQLRDNFIDYLGADPSEYETRLTTNLFLTYDQNNPDYEYTYASQSRIIANIESETSDVFFMNQEAFDAFSENGFLCDIDEVLKEYDPELYEYLKDDLRNNLLVISDNYSEASKDPSIPYHAETEEHVMGLDVSRAPIIRDAGLNGTVYVGIVANSPRLENAVAYLRYLYFYPFAASQDMPAE